MKVVIFHGWGANSQSNWFPWLKKELEKHNLEVYCPDLPNSQFPEQEEWLHKVESLTEYDEDTILIGHSLGTVLILRLLEKYKVNVAFLVAGFDRHLNIEEIKSFFKEPFDYNTIKNNADIYMLSSDNDPYIELDIAQNLSKTLGAELKVFNNKGHLSAGTKKGEFPELLELILDETKEE